MSGSETFLQPNAFAVSAKVKEVVTEIEFKDEPVLQRCPAAAFVAMETEPPWQKVIGPFGVRTGFAGSGLTVTTSGTETAEVQPAITVFTVKEPPAETVMLCVVSPLLQRFPVGLLDVNNTEPPWQKVNGPTTETVGAGSLQSVPMVIVILAVVARAS